MTVDDDYAKSASGFHGTNGAADPQATEPSYRGLGLAGECGEVVEIIKKHLRGSKLDAERLCDELGDVAYHWVRLCISAGQSPSAILGRSRNMIDARLAEKRVDR